MGKVVTWEAYALCAHCISAYKEGLSPRIAGACISSVRLIA
jgi:hypothetical protein